MGKERLVLHPSIKNLALLLAGGIALFGACLFTVAASTDVETYVAGLFGTIFFGAGTAYVFWRALNRAPVLIIDENGITDNASLTGAGLIRWDEIEGLFQYQDPSAPNVGYLAVVQKTDAAILRQTPIKRFLVTLVGGMAEADTGYNCIQIPTTMLQMPINEIIGFASKNYGVKKLQPRLGAAIKH